MHERDINGTILGLKKVVQDDMEREGATMEERLIVEGAINLLGGLLVNVTRIADALEVIAHEIRQPKD